MTVSRLARKNSSRSLRRAFIYLFFTFILAIGCLVFGLPLLIKMALFLGNIRGSYVPNESEDQISPPPPIIQPLADATNSAQINIAGFAEPGAIVDLFLNDSKKEKSVSEVNGGFLFSNINLQEGTNDIAATATDKAGNISQKSEIISVIFDNLPPKIEITQPPDQTSFPLYKRKIEVKGQTDPGASLTINGHYIIVDSQGRFTFPFTLSEGQNTLNFIAIDQAGNRTETELNLRLE